jgi:hypothetical protein
VPYKPRSQGLLKLMVRKSVTSRPVERNEETEGFCIENGIILKSSLFGDIAPCSPLNVNRLSLSCYCFLCGLRYATIEVFSALSVPQLYNTSPLAAKESPGGFSS